LREVGVTYYVLAIDEMNMLHDIGIDRFQKVVASINNAMRKDFKNFFVLFAGKSPRLFPYWDFFRIISLLVVTYTTG
jgi:hypothetical protein